MAGNDEGNKKDDINKDKTDPNRKKEKARNENETNNDDKNNENDDDKNNENKDENNENDDDKNNENKDEKDQQNKNDEEMDNKIMEDSPKNAEDIRKDDEDNNDRDKDNDNSKNDANDINDEQSRDKEMSGIPYDDTNNDDGTKQEVDDGKPISDTEKRPKILSNDPFEEKIKQENAYNERIDQVKPGDSVPIQEILYDQINEPPKSDGNQLLNDLIAEEGNESPDEIGQRINRQYSNRTLINRITFSWGFLDEYLHQKYSYVNVLLRCIIECTVVVCIFMFFPLLSIILPPHTRSYNIIKFKSQQFKINDDTEFFRENLFISLCYVIFILFSLLTDRILVIAGFCLTSLGIPIEGTVAEVLQMLVASKSHLRNAIVSILVFFLAVTLISNYQFFSHQITMCHLLLTLVFWFFCISSVLFIESFCMNILLSELRRKSFRGRIWDVNYKTFVYKKLAAIADASIPNDRDNIKIQTLIHELKNDYDSGFFLRHNDLNLTSIDQAKSIPNDIFVFLDIKDDTMTYDLIKKYFPTNHLEVYNYLSGQNSTKESNEFPPIPYETFETRCIELFHERMDIARSLYDRDNILRKLDFILFSVVLFFGLIIFLMLLNVDYKFYVASIGPTVFGLGWIFQDSIKEVYRCFVFLLISHPFDCGDRVRIDNEELTALRIDLLYSTFVTLNGKIKYIPNASMFLKPVENYRRSDLQAEDVTLLVSNATTFTQILHIRDQLVDFLKKDHTNFTGTINIKNYIPDADNIKVVLSIEHTSNFQDIKPRFIRRDIFLKELERVLDSEGITYNHAFTISD